MHRMQLQAEHNILMRTFTKCVCPSSGVLWGRLGVPIFLVCVCVCVCVFSSSCACCDNVQADKVLAYAASKDTSVSSKSQEGLRLMTLRLLLPS